MLARTGRQPDDIDLFLVPRDADGVTLTQQMTVASDTQYRVDFDGVRVPASARIGARGLGLEDLGRDDARRHHPARVRYAMGGAVHALDITVQYAKDRHQFDKPLGAFQALAHYLADAKCTVDGGRTLVWEAAWARDNGRPVDRLAPMAKLFATQTFRDVTAMAQQIFGGVGFTVEYDIQLYFRRAKACSSTGRTLVTSKSSSRPTCSTAEYPAHDRRVYGPSMRGILSAGGYVPFRRLDRSQIGATFGTGGGKGTRAVAGYDEDTTTMGVEAARLALRAAPASPVDALWFATAEPAYLDKNNASTIHAALRLDTLVPAFDFGGALRSGVGALRAALDGNGTRARRRRRTCAAASRRAATRRRAATARPRSSSAPTPTVRCSPSTSAARARPRSSSSAGARRAPPAPGSGRSASAR